MLSKDCVVDIPSVEQDRRRLPGEITNNSRCSSQSSDIYSSGDICRICHCESTADAPLITPCYCSGSLRYVHQSCLQQWIKSSNIRCCELCKFQFIMQTKIKPFNEWEYLEMSGLERKKLLCAMVFHIIAMTCVCWSLYVLIDRTLDEVKRGTLDWPFWTKLIVVGIGFMGGIVFMYIQCKAYFILCQRWKAYNRVIYVQNAPEKPSNIRRTSSGRNGLIDDERELTSNNKPFASGMIRHLTNKDFVNRSPLHTTASETTDSNGNIYNNNNNTTTTSCIDMKGVRNLHIFFNEDNRIRFHKQDIISPVPPLCSQQYRHQMSNNHLQQQRSGVAVDSYNGVVLNSYHSTLLPKNNNNENDNNSQTLICNNASWHIEIGNGYYSGDDNKPADNSVAEDGGTTSQDSSTESSSTTSDHFISRCLRSDTSSDSSNTSITTSSSSNSKSAYAGAVADLSRDNDIVNNNRITDGVNEIASDNIDKKLPVVTLQIKKSEIFIEFGGGGQQNDDNNDNNESSIDKLSQSNSKPTTTTEWVKNEPPKDELEDHSSSSSNSNNVGAIVTTKLSCCPTTDNCSSATSSDSSNNDEEEEEDDEMDIKKNKIQPDDYDPCNNELATSKLLTKNYSSVSLNNVQQGQLNNKQDELVLTDWDSNDNLLSIL